MAFLFCSSGSVCYKAGRNANAAVLSGSAMTAFSDGAEGMIEQVTNTDWTTGYAGLSTSVKNILSDVCSSLIAQKVINYDLGAYGSNRLAETMLDVNENIIQKGLNALKGKADRLKSP